MFDEIGQRSDDGGSAVFALTDGAYWCMLAESNGEAALFDAPEGDILWILELLNTFRTAGAHALKK